MSDYGVTPEGFNRKRLDQLLAELNDELRSIFGPNFNVAPESPDGQVNGVVSESNANLWELAQLCYDAFNPSAATGVTLSNLVQMNGITRLEATKTTVTLTVTGTPLSTIPSGSSVSDGTGGTVQFITLTNVVLDGSGNGLVEAEATTTGPIELTVNSLETIDTPVTGWDTVTNDTEGVTGTNEETDVELRARRKRSVAIDATAIVDAIYGEVASVTGVTQLLVLENDTDAVVDTLLPHSVKVIVFGGDDLEIATAIFLKKTLGAQTNGSHTENVLDSQGIPHPIKFQRPGEIPIYVTVNLSTFGDYPVDGDDQIKQAIVDYANGDLIIGRDFSMGDDVIHSEIYSPINSVRGFTVDSMFIGTSASPTGTADIAIALDDVSVFDIAQIVVNS